MSDSSDLFDPMQYVGPVSVKGMESSMLESFYKKMVMIRQCETEIADLIRKKKVVCPCHLAIGQEAIATGISQNLVKTDRTFGNHRSHGHYLSLGGTVYSLIAEIFGKVTGCSRGMGGSMHLFNKEVGFYGSVPIVAGTIPLAVGAGLAIKMGKSDDIAVCYFGDGASEEGVFHESINMAKMYNLPVLFVCENNFYSSHMDIRQRQPFQSIRRFADTQGIEALTIDGNDVTEVYKESGVLIDKIRDGSGPRFLEAVTFRWLGHVGPNEDIDVGVRRSKEEIELWKKRDPIRKLAEAMINAGYCTEDDLKEIDKAIKDSIIKDIKTAENDPYPDPSALLGLVYS